MIAGKQPRGKEAKPYQVRELLRQIERYNLQLRRDQPGGCVNDRCLSEFFVTNTDAPVRRFVPRDLDVADFAQLEPLYRALHEREIDSAAALERWLLDYSELTAVVSEYGSRRHIEQSCHTDDPEIEKGFLHFVERVAPRVKPWAFKLQKKYLESGFHEALADPKYRVLNREWQVEVELFRDKNVPIQTELAKINNEYDKLCGAMLVDFDGRQRTLQQMARYLEEPDRTVRQSAWETIETRRAQDHEAIDDIFDRMLERRAKLAANAGLGNYRDYAWKSMARFDYTPEDCHRFADAIERVCMPLVRKLNEQRREALGLARLRPWDLSVDVHNRPALKPFDPDDVQEMVRKCREIFHRLSPTLAREFDRLKPGRNLDLESRKGKRPGGYQASLAEVKQPFIFMNAAGLHRDVETMLHEGGHAFHYMWSNHEPVLFLQHAPIEFCEVASMSMELLADAHMDVFYERDEAARAVRKHLEGVIRILPWIATIDQFQHWLYTHEGHNRDERTAAWLTVLDRFSDSAIDWSSYEAHRAAMWQRQGHLFHVPFYYVEYGIAQLGALQLWQQAQRDKDVALANYRKALSLGHTRPLPDLFATAGIRFDFTEATLTPLMKALESELNTLPQ